MSREKALEHKALGNKEFSAQNFPEAIVHFTNAIAEDPTDHVFFSNRSACYSSTGEYTKALEDGEKCVSLKPDWAKGYSRKGLAEYHLGKLEEAEKTYNAGLKLAPEDAALKEGLGKVQSAQAGGGGGGDLPGDLDMTALMRAVQKNPKVATYLSDKDLMQKFKLLMSAKENPQLMQQMSSVLMSDERLLELFMAIQGIDMPTKGGPGDEPFRPEPAPKKPKKEEPEPPKDERTEEQKTADSFKEEGNKLYKNKQFEEAIEQYDKAIAAVEGNDMTYYNNKAAVYLEMKKYEECETMLKEVLEKKYDMNRALPGGANFEKVGKVLNRLAVCYSKQQKYDLALETYNRSLAEDNNKNTRNAIRELEKEKARVEKEAYIDPELAEQHREKGNEYFKANQFVEAKKEYDEAVRRNPKDAKLWSNRAGALQKLMAHPDALKDLEEALRLDPNFVKAYSRKGASHFFMKDYNKALKSYEDGLKLDPNDEGCKNGRMQVISKIQSQAMGGGGGADGKGGNAPDPAQVQEAMKDPEIQAILKDPQMNIILQQMQDDPKTAQSALKDPKVANAINKLMGAGILRMA